MRLYGVARVDVEAIVQLPLGIEYDERRNLRLAGLDGRGRAIIVVVAGDDPNFVITTFPDD
jgi:hypothetical protein